MPDRVSIQIIFRRALWVCPKCGQEDLEDFSMSGGNKYEHNCSKCDTWFNSWKNYEGIVSLSEAEYETVKEEDITAKKDALTSAWIDQMKNPPVYEEPSKEVLEQLKAQKETEVAQLTAQIAAKEAEVIG